MDRAKEAVDASIAEEETARTANAHAQAEFERWEADQPERVYPPYEGQPRYIELPPTESTFPSVADLDRAEEDDLRETYYETLRRHADGDGTTIEDVEAAYRALHGRLPPR